MKKFLIGTLCIVTFGYLSLVGYTMTKMTIEDLVSCSLDSESFKIPAKACEQFMFTFRTTEKDIEQLNANAGLEHIFYHENPKKYQFAERLMTKGLDINAAQPTKDKLTPLHLAVLYNDAERLKFLLAHQANTNKKDSNHLTPLELAKKLHKEDDKLQNRAEIIQLLSAIED